MGWQAALDFTFQACFTPARMENPTQTVETYAPIFMPLLETPKGEVALVELAVKFVEYVFLPSAECNEAVRVSLELAGSCFRHTSVLDVSNVLCNAQGAKGQRTV